VAVAATTAITIINIARAAIKASYDTVMARITGAGEGATTPATSAITRASSIPADAAPYDQAVAE
jgi:hypothetical protein